MAVHGSTPVILALLIAAALPGRIDTVDSGSGSRGESRPEPPSHASARFYRGVGACTKLLSVFVPAQGGRYAVGLSFSYRDLDQDGLYTPGVDKMEVCVNCDDACDWGP